MKLLRYDASKDDTPRWRITLTHCTGHSRWAFNGIHIRRGMRCYIWIWRMCK